MAPSVRPSVFPSCPAPAVSQLPELSAAGRPDRGINRPILAICSRAGPSWLGLQQQLTRGSTIFTTDDCKPGESIHQGVRAYLDIPGKTNKGAVLVHAGFHPPQTEAHTSTLCRHVRRTHTASVKAPAAPPSGRRGRQVSPLVPGRPGATRPTHSAPRNTDRPGAAAGRRGITGTISRRRLSLSHRSQLCTRARSRLICEMTPGLSQARAINGGPAPEKGAERRNTFTEYNAALRLGVFTVHCQFIKIPFECETLTLHSFYKSYNDRTTRKEIELTK